MSSTLSSPSCAKASFNPKRPISPLSGQAFSKQFALPYDLWGLLYDDWAPSFEKDGLSVFIQGLDKRGPDNRRKRIYISAVTADLYPMYADKVRAFFGQRFMEEHAGKPLMQRYLDSYPDLFWDLHLGVKGDGLPDHVRQIGQSFNTVLGFRDNSPDCLRELHEGSSTPHTAERVDRRKSERDHEREDKGPREDLRLLSPNPGSISTLHKLQPVHASDRYVYGITPHPPGNFSPVQWENPLEFNPDRYIDAPTSDQTGEGKAKALGFAKFPFAKTSFPVAGRLKLPIAASAPCLALSMANRNPYATMPASRPSASDTAAALANSLKLPFSAISRGRCGPTRSSSNTSMSRTQPRSPQDP